MHNRSLGISHKESSLKAPFNPPSSGRPGRSRARSSMLGAIFTAPEMPVPSVAPHNVMQGAIFTAPQMPVPSVAPHNVMQGAIFTAPQMPVPSVAPHNVMQGAIFTAPQMPVPVVGPHNVMQGAIFTAPQMPVPVVGPHNVMQGTMRRSGSLGSSGYDILNGDRPPMGTSLVNQGLGALNKDADEANKAKKEHGPLRNKLRDTMSAIINGLGYDKKSKEWHRCYFRLGEVLARADSNIAALGWGYAGPNSNEPNSKDAEGTDFLSAAGEKKKALGFEGRIKAEEEKSLGTGRMAQYRDLLKSTNTVAEIIKKQFDALPTVGEKRALFSGMLVYFLSNDKAAKVGWAKGMSFLPPAASYSPPAELATIKKAGLKKEEGILGIAQKEATKAAKKEIMSQFAGDKGKAEAAAAAYANMPAEALADTSSSAASSDTAYEMPPEPKKNIGLVALAAAAVGAFLIFKS